MTGKKYVLGILQTDKVSNEFVDEFGDYPCMFTKLLADDAAEFRVIDVGSDVLPDPLTCDGYVITGSRASVYDDLPWIPALVAFVRTAIEHGHKVVGVCFGHQLIAHYFGGRVASNPEGWAVGVHCSEILHDKPWMQPPVESLALLSSHKDQVTQLPPEAELIATNAFCLNAGFVMGNEVMTIQGHPEFDKSYAAALMGSRRELLGKAVYQAGMESLTMSLDNERFAQWIWRFLLR